MKEEWVSELCKKNWDMYLHKFPVSNDENILKMGWSFRGVKCIWNKISTNIPKKSTWHKIKPSGLHAVKLELFVALRRLMNWDFWCLNASISLYSISTKSLRFENCERSFRKVGKRPDSKFSLSSELHGYTQIWSYFKLLTKIRQTISYFLGNLEI